METKKTLKEKLGIRDFVCRGQSRIILDKIVSYYQTVQKLEQISSQTFTQNFLDLGYTPKMIELGVLSNLIQKLSDQEIVDLEIKYEMSEEWTQLKSKLDTLIKTDVSLPKEKGKTLKNNIRDIIKQLAEIKKLEITKIAEAEYVKNLKNIKLNSNKIEITNFDPEGQLFNLENEIIEGFLIGRLNTNTGIKYDEALVVEIISGNHELSFSKDNFYELTQKISEERENALNADVLNFFTNMRVSKFQEDKANGQTILLHSQPTQNNTED